MWIERVGSPGLSQDSWFLVDGVEAVVIDPRRDVDVYLGLLRCHRATLRAVVETHRHEDFASGALALGRRAGAPVRHGVGLHWTFGEDVGDGEEIPFGDAHLHVLATPGHTVESISLVLLEPKGRTPLAVFTGDTLLAGSVGRVDLYGRKQVDTAARELHASLHRRLLPLGDGVVVHPCHRAGTSSAPRVADRPTTTIGYERLTNPLLGLSEDAFVRACASVPHLVPPAWLRMEVWNLHGAPPWGWRNPPRALSPARVEEALGHRARVVDVRASAAFAGAHIPGALSLPLPELARLGSWLLTDDRDFVLVVPDEVDPGEVAAELARIGIDRVAGYLAPGFDAWMEAGRPTRRVPTLTPGELGLRRATGWDPVVLDVREAHEWETGVIPGAQLLFVGDLPARLDQVPRGRPVVCTCGGGARGGAAASILAAHGHTDVWNMAGGMRAARGLGWNLPRPDAAQIQAALARAPQVHARARVLERV